jgi:hypothetical protein
MEGAEIQSPPPTYEFLTSAYKTTTVGLIYVLFSVLYCNFVTGLKPDTLLSPENVKHQDDKKIIDHLVLIRASHLKRTIPHYAGWDIQ